MLIFFLSSYTGYLFQKNEKWEWSKEYCYVHVFNFKRNTPSAFSLRVMLTFAMMVYKENINFYFQNLEIIPDVFLYIYEGHLISNS